MVNRLSDRDRSQLVHVLAVDVPMIDMKGKCQTANATSATNNRCVITARGPGSVVRTQLDAAIAVAKPTTHQRSRISRSCLVKTLRRPHMSEGQPTSNPHAARPQERRLQGHLNPRARRHTAIRWASPRKGVTHRLMLRTPRTGGGGYDLSPLRSP